MGIVLPRLQPDVPGRALDPNKDAPPVEEAQQPQPHHHEGDGTTPLGTFAIGSIAYGIGPDPGTQLTYHRLVCGDCREETF